MSVSTDEYTARELVSEAGDEELTLIEALDAASTEDCVECGMTLGGLLGTFGWGIVNGQGSCGQCGFPYQYLHRFPRPADPAKGKRRDMVLHAFVPIAEMPLREAGEIE